MKNLMNNKNSIAWKKGDICFWPGLNPRNAFSILSGTILNIQHANKTNEGTASIQEPDGTTITKPLTELYKTPIDAGIAEQIYQDCRQISSIQKLIEFAYNKRPSIEIDMGDYMIDMDDDDFDDEDYNEYAIDIGGWRQNMEVWKSVLERKTLELLGVDLLQN